MVALSAVLARPCAVPLWSQAASGMLQLHLWRVLPAGRWAAGGGPAATSGRAGRLARAGVAGWGKSYLRGWLPEGRALTAGLRARARARLAYCAGIADGVWARKSVLCSRGLQLSGCTVPLTPQPRGHSLPLARFFAFAAVGFPSEATSLLSQSNDGIFSRQHEVSRRETQGEGQALMAALFLI